MGEYCSQGGALEQRIAIEAQIHGDLLNKIVNMSDSDKKEK
jgi:hypothetical protein